MPLWQWLLDSVGVLLLLLLGYGLSLVARRRVLDRRGGTFEMSVRLRPGAGARGWVLGLGRYTDDRLEWFRIFSLSPRPKQGWDRSTLRYRERRLPAGTESIALYSGHLVVDLQTADGRLEMAMSDDALTGLLSWLEAAPPGRPSQSP